MRLMLENLSVRYSSFVTLTYADEYLPLSGVYATLRLSDYQKWLKRLRKAIYPEKVRYFVVGEYGGITERPHYHCALFGIRGCVYEDSRLAPRELCDCDSCVLLRSTWPSGFVHQGTIELKSMQYLVGYLLKGMYRRDDERLRGREPEFSRMSLRPGIGAVAMSVVARDLDKYVELDKSMPPPALRIGNRILPIGRYLRKRLRMEMGLGDVATEKEVEAAREKMRPLYEIAKAYTDQSLAYGEERVSDKVLYRLLVEANREKARQLEAREKIWKGKVK